jgi:hypothetical protein
MQDAKILRGKFSDNRAYGFGSNPSVKKLSESGSKGFYMGNGPEGQINMFYGEIYGFAMTSGLGTYCVKPS